MAEVIGLAEPNTEIDGLVLQSDLSKLDSATVNLVMARCIAGRLGSDPVTGQAQGSAW